MSAIMVAKAWKQWSIPYKEDALLHKVKSTLWLSHSKFNRTPHFSVFHNSPELLSELSMNLSFTSAIKYIAYYKSLQRGLEGEEWDKIKFKKRRKRLVVLLVVLPWRSPVMFGAVQQSSHVCSLPPCHIHHQDTCQSNRTQSRDI